eukprot:m.151683 g.151683  ORF g.151683 m.151683 type:complete len:1363 (+) comp30773_c0_seq2:182-4270(+)
MKRVFAIPGKVHGGTEPKAKWQRKVGNFLATAGTNRTVQIWDRNGASVDVIDLAGNCVDLDWCHDGALLAIINAGNENVILWNAHTQEKREIKTDQKARLTFLRWSQVGYSLAIGASKGNLVLYNHQTGRQLPILGKHGNKAITCGSWSVDNLLCLGGEDNTISLSNENGNILEQPDLTGPPSNVQFYNSPSTPTENTISIVIDKKTLYLWKSTDPEAPMELEFQQKYGSIVAYHWFGDHKLLLGFSKGYFIVVSTEMSHIGQELHQSRNHKMALTDVAISHTLNKAASCGDGLIKIHDLTDCNDIYAQIPLDDDIGKLCKMDWSDDGQLLSVTLANGNVYTYLTKLPMLGETSRTTVCHLSALQELTVADIEDEVKPRCKISIPIEPAFVAVGPYHVAAGFNNQAWIYGQNDIVDKEYKLLTLEPKEYVRSIDQMQLSSDFAAVLCDGILQLHEIEEGISQSDIPHEPKAFPGKDGSRVTACVLTEQFCIYAVDNGILKYFSLEDWVEVNEYRHECAITYVCADPTSTRLIFIDDKSDVYLYNPVTDAKIKVVGASTMARGVLWENEIADFTMTFMVYDDEAVNVFTYDEEYYKGPRISHVGSTPRVTGTKPLLVYNGALTSLLPSGNHTTLPLSTHDARIVDGSNPEACVRQNIKLCRYQDAFVATQHLQDSDSKDCIAELYNAALLSTNINLAIRCAQLMGDPAKALSLESLVYIEDRKLLCGHIAILCKDFDTAEKLFLSSSSPIEALTMNRDLLNFAKALDQADVMDKSQIPYISLEYANQLEFTGVFVQAHTHYEKGVTGLPGDKKHDLQCQSGIVRMLMRRGDYRAGKELGQEINSTKLWRECGVILQGLNQTAEAAEMFVNGKQFDKAALMYIKMKNWKKVGEILPQVQSPKILVQFAKARETNGEFREAADAYQQAKEYDAVVRISLDKLRDIERAVAMVKESKSIEGAKLVAKFFMDSDQPESAIKYMVMSGAQTEAFTLAQQNGKMDVFAKVVDESGTGSDSDYENIATHYENISDKLNAGRFFLRSKRYKKALNLLMRVVSSEENEHIELAIEAVGLARDDAMTAEMEQYLLGELDEIPKDAVYLFKMYKALQHFPEAAKTAVVIARDEQNNGNYKNAKNVLFDMYRQLHEEEIRIPNDMAQNLMILHSYSIVKLQKRLGNNKKAARMLIRVSNVISSFPIHVVNLLTSCVVLCWKADMKNSAFEWASMLMRPEYRAEIEPKYKQKLEKIVRKRETGENEDEFSPCPFCQASVNVLQLDCSECGNILPYCSITGVHMVSDDWCSMPCCGMPALFSEASTLFGEDADSEPCPMCLKIPKASDIRKVPDCGPLLRKFKHQHATDSSASQSEA